MRVCSRCKDISKKLGTILLDKKDATEYDLCTECLEEFKDNFINQNPPESPLAKSASTEGGKGGSKKGKVKGD